MFRTALEELKDRHLDRLALVHVLSREKHELAALHGRLDAARIQALLPGLAPPAAIAEAFVCGPEGLPAAATEALTALGLPSERIHVERFTPSSSPSPGFAGGRRTAAAPEWSASADDTKSGRGGGSPVPITKPTATATAAITLDGATREVPIAPGETVLEAGLRAGLDLPWSCKGGMCCTCRAKVTDGAVEMAQNYSLQPWETEAGFVLTCQSRPTTPNVSVDYDAA
jgi:ring-1,2-phenylacetyl-CoA epoxidase subunit PaaE